MNSEQKRYELLFNNSLNGIAYCKMEYDANDKPIDFTYVAINKAFVELTNLKNAVGKKVTDIIPSIYNTNPEIFEIYGRVAKGGAPELFETYIDYLKAWFLVSVYCPEKGYFVAVFNVNAQKLEDKINILEKEVEDLKEKE